MVGRSVGYVIGAVAIACGQATASVDASRNPAFLPSHCVFSLDSRPAASPIAQGLSERLGVQVFADNRPSANGAIATELTARAAPDGYTFYEASSGHTTNAILRTKARYDPIKDFTPLSLYADEVMGWYGML